VIVAAGWQSNWFDVSGGGVSLGLRELRALPTLFRQGMISRN
jgi:hypothetical protein